MFLGWNPLVRKNNHPVRLNFCLLSNSADSSSFSWLGLIHTRHFCTQYCDKKILRHWHFLTTDFYWTTKVSFYKNLVYLVLWFDKSLPWPIDIHVPKIFFIAILSVKMSRVNKALVFFFFGVDKLTYLLERFTSKNFLKLLGTFRELFLHSN